MKKEIRQKMLELRTNFEKREEASRKIAEIVTKLAEFKTAETVMVYLPIKGEVLTDKIIEKAKQEGKNIVVPIIREEIYPAKLEGTLEEASFKVLEPVNPEIVPPSEIDLCIVPGVAFDEGKKRLGFGKGYYDKFLPQIKGKSVGICFDFQLVENLPTEKHDVPLDFVVTERRSL